MKLVNTKGERKLEQKLYYIDAYTKDFTTKIIKQDYDKEDNLYVVLNETAFYPTGGGQPYDTGTLNGTLVTNVEEVNGEIRHFIAEQLETAEVEGKINWERRFDHMQQHAAQHILSAAFWDHFNIPTIGFHLGKETVTIDLETENLPAETIEKAVQIANNIVFENHPIRIQWMNLEEAKTLPLRKEPTLTENIRVVIIENFDYNGCGGTHPRRTGEVGLIQVLNWERNKGGIRLTFIAGWRTLKLMGQQQQIMKDVSKQLNSSETDIPAKVAQLLISQKENEKAIQTINEKLLFAEANELLQQPAEIHAGFLISKVFTNRSMQEVAKLSAIIIEQQEHAITYFVIENDDKLQCILACGKTVTLDMNALLKDALPAIEGKGGGNKKSARGGGKAIMSGDEFLHQLISSLQSAV
ncbi:alanyl-tRNA editing protein [Bacillus toyonensis]|uniref:Alanyl-tRNA editing protein n=2 Tax=Bacillus toyonensis TaxID=155322 RepID=A0A2B5W3G2_9BACI|nr:alanyl-tRNA editing protein [Bacillus sp. FDAARGOS_235]EEL39186.1 Threonyl/alanyl tRNA synthetase SAD [Bacillus cereus Rock3-29]KAB0445861.1 alanyl-tRNA editing protein [Lysinibacillus sp. VIA-II-2016]KXY41297.1 alanyl-tRNA editing protein [Bacillus cereus]MBE7137698.1 alanyl-tRNA editing protein [Bacillus toyonensis]MBH0358866.1 alanyl-tRNA editing protein [Bacillus toyonensis biovar Thuringiensis]